MSQGTPRPFDKEHAARYDREFQKLAPFKDALHILTRSLLGDVGESANVLCVGAGTGAELLYLAEAFPHFRFTALDVSEAMLEVCKERVERAGFSDRCRFHQGPVASLPVAEVFDAATCILVSQFLVDVAARRELFSDIALRLAPGGALLSADLAHSFDDAKAQRQFHLWRRILEFSGRTSGDVDRFFSVVGKMVAVPSTSEVEQIIESAGFEPPTQFFQAGLIHAWSARRV